MMQIMPQPYPPQYGQTYYPPQNGQLYYPLQYAQVQYSQTPSFDPYYVEQMRLLADRQRRSAIGEVDPAYVHDGYATQTTRSTEEPQYPDPSRVLRSPAAYIPVYSDFRNHNPAVARDPSQFSQRKENPRNRTP
jgi:hypothetical protein